MVQASVARPQDKLRDIAEAVAGDVCSRIRSTYDAADLGPAPELCRISLDAASRAPGRTTAT